MKKLIVNLMVLIILFGTLVTNCYAQLGDLGEPRSSYDMGSARILEGQNLIVSVFVNTPTEFFNKEKVKERLVILERACNYLEAEANNYGRNCSFIYDFEDNKDLYYKVKIYREPDDSQEFEEYLDKKIDLWTGTMAPFDELKEKYKADNIFMVVYFGNEGRSYAICYDGIDSEKESLILFDSADPSTVAHEILHLYGAHDFYEDAEYNKDAVNYIKKKYPNDIMLTVNRGNTVKREIGLLTAYHLGWLDKVTDIKKFPELER